MTKLWYIICYKAKTSNIRSSMLFSPAVQLVLDSTSSSRGALGGGGASGSSSEPFHFPLGGRRFSRLLSLPAALPCGLWPPPLPPETLWKRRSAIENMAEFVEFFSCDAHAWLSSTGLSAPHAYRRHFDRLAAAGPLACVVTVVGSPPAGAFNDFSGRRKLSWKQVVEDVDNELRMWAQRVGYVKVPVHCGHHLRTTKLPMILFNIPKKRSHPQYATRPLKWPQEHLVSIIFE